MFFVGLCNNKRVILIYFYRSKDYYKGENICFLIIVIIGADQF